LAIFALLAPAGTPEPIIARLHREAVRILALPDVRKRFDELEGADGHLRGNGRATAGRASGTSGKSKAGALLRGRKSPRP